ncbi:hypothetical protein ACPUER_08800 [Burkholderia sp. DN3021]|uniref:hypothetical protein n=1 Tax=Burkholderia TaxID=32008 RepID=UPI00158E0D83|nr:hypothetical protein [Burkholderia pyrrocinia]
MNAGEVVPAIGNAAENVAPRRSCDTMRRIVASGLHAAAIAHLFVGVAVPWLAGAPFDDAYRRGIALHFRAGATPVPARAADMADVADRRDGVPVPDRRARAA